MSVRTETCGGCWRDCRRDTTVSCPLTYIETKMSLENEVESGIRIGTRAHITTRTVLGRMFELKEEAWARHLASCPHHGEVLPKTIPDLLEWSIKLRPFEVRLALGVDRKTALGMKTALKVRELSDYYRLICTSLPKYEPDIPTRVFDDDPPF